MFGTWDWKTEERYRNEVTKQRNEKTHESIEIGVWNIRIENIGMCVKMDIH